MKVSVKNIRKNVMHVVGGTVLTEDFFLKNTRFLFLVVFIVVLYIGNRYSCIEKLAKIEALQKELKDVKYESLAISSQLIGVSRQSQVQSRINKDELGLEISKTPIYKIEK
ncbi:MAG: FtsL-like putative cell division protein [Dysgonomonas sp.]